MELRSGGMEYEVELDASEGSVLSYKAELKYKEQLTATLEQAKETALKDAGLTAGQVTLQKAVTYEEDGRPQHKVIFRTDTARYTYVMDGSTGEFLAAERKDFSGNAASSASSSVSQGSSFSAGSISADQARCIALEHAGVSGSDLTKYDSELDRHHNRQVYEIEFETGSAEYDYEIDAETGDILSHQKEIRKDDKGTASESGAAISADQARSIALEHAGVSGSDLTKYDSELDRHHNRQVYEIEFRTSGVKYEYQIDARTGEILHSQKENH